MICKSFSKNSEKINNFECRDYLYDFGDGWVAKVSVSKVSSEEKQRLQKISDGFSLYDWMVDSIINNGEII